MHTPSNWLLLVAGTRALLSKNIMDKKRSRPEEWHSREEWFAVGSDFFFSPLPPWKLKEDKLWIRFFPLFSLALFFIRPKTSLTAFLCFSFPASLPAHSLIYTPNYWILSFFVLFFSSSPAHSHIHEPMCPPAHFSTNAWVSHSSDLPLFSGFQRGVFCCNFLQQRQYLYGRIRLNHMYGDIGEGENMNRWIWFGPFDFKGFGPSSVVSMNPNFNWVNSKNFEQKYPALAAQKAGRPNFCRLASWGSYLRLSWPLLALIWNKIHSMSSFVKPTPLQALIWTFS